MFNGSVKVQMVDVINAIGECKVQLLIGGIILLAGMILLILGKVKKERSGKIFTVQGCVAVIMALVITVTWACMGPQYSLVNNIFAGNDEIKKDNKEKSLETAEKIAEEGITLLKNKDNALPLAQNTKLNVFGWSSTSPVYGGGGSGSSDSSEAVSLIEGLHEAGFETNLELETFYKNFREGRPSISFFGVDFTIPEPTMKEYEEADIFENAKKYSDTALVVIARSSGEGSDLAMNLSNNNNFTIGENGEPVTFSTQEDDIDGSKSYLELSNREIAMLDEVTKDFSHVVVVVNSAQPMELGWVDEYDNINGVIWCPSPGQMGFRALGKILNGEVNPSGHLVDTFVYDLHETPYINNIGSFAYENYEDVTGDKDNKAIYVNYNEGIYVGYKFYETAAAEGLIDYDSVVQYPFGYGLSYTSFKANIENVQDDGNTITMDIKVENTGDTAGKFTAEIFFTPPYNNGGIEKASMNLVEYAKTGFIEAGKSETVSVEFSYEDMVSYDSECMKSTNGAYVLESGEYGIHLCSDSHTILDTYTAVVDQDIIYDEEHDGKRSSDKVTATNQFDYAKGDVTYLSRADQFANYEEAVAALTQTEMTDDIKANYSSRITFDASQYDDPDVKMPATGQKNGIKIQDMTGLDYNDEKWNDLLDELTVDELMNIVGDGTYHIPATESINLPYIFSTDGPTAVNSFFTGKSGTAFPAPILMTATWNQALAAEFGDCIGQELEDYGFTGWFGSGMNIHRTAFSGRNFEYYSEDGTLSGIVAANEIAAVRGHGIITFIKHFALNDSETDRAKGICTWSNEQAIREIYLKPFEYAVKEGGSNGIMNSKNGIGSKWVGANPELMTNVLRNEWGFTGAVITDSLDTASEYYQSPDAAVRAGTDLMMPMGYTTGEAYWKDASAGTIAALRTAAHHTLYALANSNAMDIGTGMPIWVITFWTVDVVLVLLLGMWEVMTIRTYRKKEAKAE